MRKIFLISFVLALCLICGVALSDDNRGETENTEEVKTESDCKKKCVERDGYGKCVKFEKKCG